MYINVGQSTQLPIMVIVRSWEFWGVVVIVLDDALHVDVQRSSRKHMHVQFNPGQEERTFKFQTPSYGEVDYIKKKLIHNDSII